MMKIVPTIVLVLASELFVSIFAKDSLVLNVKGTYTGTLNFPNLCFTPDVFDIEKGTKVGTALDCLDVSTGIATVEFYVNGGTLKASGQSYAASGAFGDFNTLVGVLPTEGVDSVISATGTLNKYQNAQARLSGAINNQFFTLGTIRFDCIWVITQN